MTGWMTVISWHAALASAAFLAGGMIQGLLVLNYPTYSFERWHGTLLFYAVIVCSLFVNTYLARLLPSIESVILILHVIGFFCILIPLTYLAPHHSAKEVFATFANEGSWSSTGLSFFVGLATSMFGFIGKPTSKDTCSKITNNH
jgi:amino acid transporter